MTLRQAINLVKRLSRKGSVDDVGDDITNVLYDCFNAARRDVLLRLPKHYLRKTGTFNMAVGSRTYSLATDVQKLLFLYYTQDNQNYFLTRVESEEDFYRNFNYHPSGSSNRRRPTHYF